MNNDRTTSPYPPFAAPDASETPLPAWVPLEELVRRCRSAAKRLDDLVPDYSPDEQIRLKGKAEGVRLAISYIEEALRAHA